MKKVLLSLMVAVLLIAAVATFVMAAPGGVTDKGALKDLAAVRQATDKYHDVGVALTDGYGPATPCIPGMGIHYVNFGLVDPFVDPLTPEVLMYIPTDEGLKLVAVEYLSVGPPAPVLFGETFGPGPPPISFALHVWLWQGNPDGIFADLNPNVSCPTP